jgi:hypothetical protein
MDLPSDSVWDEWSVSPRFVICLGCLTGRLQPIPLPPSFHAPPAATAGSSNYQSDPQCKLLTLWDGGSTSYQHRPPALPITCLLAPPTGRPPHGHTAPLLTSPPTHRLWRDVFHTLSYTVYRNNSTFHGSKQSMTKNLVEQKHLL